MTYTISTLAAQPLRDRLEALLGTADLAFHDYKDQAGRPIRLDARVFEFPIELVELPNLVAQLQKFIGRKSTVRFPFWRCVKAVDKAARSLHLVIRLEKMVRRATSIEPGPLYKLLTLTPALPDSDQQLLKALQEHILNDALKPLKEVENYLPLFRRVDLSIYDPVVNQIPPTSLSDPFTKKVAANLAYADFVAHYALWNARYYGPLCQLYDFLLCLENDGLTELVGKILIGSVYSVKLEQLARKRMAGIQRQHRYRNTLRKAKGIPPLPMKEKHVFVPRRK